MACMIGQIIVKLEPHYDIGPEGAGAIGATLGEMQRTAERLGLRLAVTQLNRINEYVGRGPNQNILRTMLIDLHQRMCGELNDRFLLYCRMTTSLITVLKNLFLAEKQSFDFQQCPKILQRLGSAYVWPAIPLRFFI